MFKKYERYYSDIDFLLSRQYLNCKIITSTNWLFTLSISPKLEGSCIKLLKYTNISILL